MIRCKNCNKEIILNNKGTHAETLIVICPVCGSVVEASSCYGFGPVWPACIYCGDRLIAEIRKTGPYRDNNFELQILDNFLSVSSHVSVKCIMPEKGG